MEMQVFGFIPVTTLQKINIGPTEFGIEDYAVFQWVALVNGKEEKMSRVSRSRIRYRENGDAYFKSNGCVYYFKDAIRL